MLRRRFAIVLALALAAACRDNARSEAGQAPDSAQAAYQEYVPPQLTPAESAAAVAKIKADGEAMTRKVMGPEYSPPPKPHVDTPEKQYASCIAQARSVDEPVRSTILKACERFKQPPQ